MGLRDAFTGRIYRFNKAKTEAQRRAAQGLQTACENLWITEPQQPRLCERIIEYIWAHDNTWTWTLNDWIDTVLKDFQPKLLDITAEQIMFCKASFAAETWLGMCMSNNRDSILQHLMLEALVDVYRLPRTFQDEWRHVIASFELGLPFDKCFDILTDHRWDITKGFLCPPRRFTIVDEGTWQQFGGNVAKRAMDFWEHPKCGDSVAEAIRIAST